MRDAAFLRSSQRTDNLRLNACPCRTEDSAGRPSRDARVVDMVEPLIRTKRAARLSLAVSLVALTVFIVLLALLDEGRRIWAWGTLLAAITATFSVVTALKAPE